MEFLEYPKALYLAGNARIVGNAADEAAALHEGFDNWYADHARTHGAVDLPHVEESAQVAEKPADAAPAAPAKRKYTKKAA